MSRGTAVPGGARAASPPTFGLRRHRGLAGRRRAIAALGALLCTPLAMAQDPRAGLAQDAARDWLALVDRADYAGAWKAAGTRFRQGADVARWVQSVTRVRSARGAVIRRTTYRTRFTNQFRGAPPGDYAFVLFRTAYANEADAGEQVTLEREPDGGWRVVGYLVQ
jgi:hypothetical protein